MKRFCRNLCVCVGALLMAVSCYDDSALVDRMTQLEYRVEALELSLNKELKALNDLISSNVYIKECEANDDGSYDVTLSSGVEFTIYPDQSLKSVVTYITMGGTKYWAYYDEDGEAQLIYDAQGARIPITTVPKVVAEDGDNYLVFGTERYPLTGNSVFSDYVLNKDTATGEVHSVTFTFGEDMTFTVTVDGGNGFRFVYQDLESLIPVTEQYVSYGRTEKMQVEMIGVVDYVYQAPVGWTVKEETDSDGILFFNITAPVKSKVMDGTADASGVLKVVSVLEGGSAKVTRLSVSAEPFKTFDVFADDVTVKICSGLQKYAYGVCAKADFDETALFSAAKTLLTSSAEIPAKFGVETKSVDFRLSDFYGDMTAGEEYVLWAVPASYDEEKGFLVDDGTMVTKSFSRIYVTFEIPEADVLFNDATLKMKLAGVSSYYAGVFRKPESSGTSMFDNILPYIEYGDIKPVTVPMEYDGSVFGFNGTSLVAEPNTTYVAWLIIAEDGRKVYEESDVVCCEFTTDDIVSGSAIEVNVSDQVLGYVDVSAKLSSAEAFRIYYTFLKTENASAYATEESKAKYLLSSGCFFDGNEKVVNSATDAKLTFDTEQAVTMFAMAVDKNGRYGSVEVVPFKTKAITYDSAIAPELSILVNEPNNVVASISSSAADVEYIYWVGKANDSFWTGSSTLGASETKASKYMFLNQANSRFVQTARNYPVNEGKVTFTDLDLKADYVLVVMAKKGDVTSPAKVLKFTTKSLALGTIVTSSGAPDAWSAGKPSVQFLKEYFEAPQGSWGYGTYAFDFTPVSGASLTYYVVCGTYAYFNDGDFSSNIPTDDLIIGIVEQADRSRDTNVAQVENWTYPEDYWFYTYKHGFPTYGNGVIFPNETAHDALCDCGGCKTGTKTVNNVSGLHWEQVVLYYSNAPVRFTNASAVGTEGTDKVFVTCRDAEGNYYEPYVFDVPYEYFMEAASRN